MAFVGIVSTVEGATKAWVRELLRGLTRELAAHAPLKNPAVLADQLTLMVGGIYGAVQALGDGGPARDARTAAESLIEAAAR